jgi:Rhodopirellula transposase DDE domain
MYWIHLKPKEIATLYFDKYVDNLRWWWFNYGINDYPEARNLLFICDAGGGNSYRHHAFKKELQAFAKEIGIDIIVAHYPPYASKWNPIEHRLFCHVHQAMSGQMFKDYQFVKRSLKKLQPRKA